MNVPASVRGPSGLSALPADHDHDCILVAEVLSRIQAAQGWRQLAVDPEFELRSFREIVGRAGVYLGVVVEHGCGCASNERRTAA